jgi:hypothetical protein
MNVHMFTLFDGCDEFADDLAVFADMMTRRHVAKRCLVA